jgi:transcriptional regulator with XRE-family HTH domain
MEKIPIGDNIRLARNRLGFTQEYMAEKLGISKQRYRQLENEEQQSLTLGRLSEIAAILEMDLITLLRLHQVKFSLDSAADPDDFYITRLNNLIKTQQELLSALQKNIDLG